MLPSFTLKVKLAKPLPLPLEGGAYVNFPVSSSDRVTVSPALMFALSSFSVPLPVAGSVTIFTLDSLSLSASL